MWLLLLQKVKMRHDFVLNVSIFQGTHTHVYKYKKQLKIEEKSRDDSKKKAIKQE